MSFRELVQVAAALDCTSVEVRNDLKVELFDGLSAEEASAIAVKHGIGITAVAEVHAFNDGSDRAFEQLTELAEQASRCGASGVSLIPWLADAGTQPNPSSESGVQHERLCRTLSDFASILAKHKLIGFIEPLGFEHSSLRFKADAVAAIETVGDLAPYKLIHDTFHHYLASETVVFPEHTGLVHVSGVAAAKTNSSTGTHSITAGSQRTELTDTDRGLVNSDDVLGNLEQLEQLKQGGYEGPVSIEAFAPSVHSLKNPKAELLACFNHIGPSMRMVAA